jgi:hypothetical protein
MLKHVTFAVASVVAAALIASCSSSTHPTPAPPASASSLAGEVRQQVLAAMQAAQSFHVAGNGTGADGMPIQIDIHFGPHKTAGSIIQSGQKVELINPGGPSVYFKAPDALWKSEGGDAAVTLFHEKWVKVPAADKRLEQLSKSFDKDTFIGTLSSGGTGDAGALRKVGTATVLGTPAVRYEVPSDHTQVYVAASGPPVLLKLVNPAKDGGTITFTDYNKPYAFSPPPAGQIVDFGQLPH